MVTKAVRVTPASAPKPKNVAEYITWQIQLCGKQQTEIAEQAGFEKPNVITMIKQGKTKVPLNKIGSLAKALEIDPVFFMRMCINEYVPDLADTIQQITNQPIISKNELDFIEAIRSAKVSNPKLRTDTERKKFREFIETLKSDNETN
jgi:transcriptional regulator with XRE-family HTH domain